MAARAACTTRVVRCALCAVRCIRHHTAGVYCMIQRVGYHNTAYMEIWCILRLPQVWLRLSSWLMPAQHKCCGWVPHLLVVSRIMLGRTPQVRAATCWRERRAMVLICSRPHRGAYEQTETERHIIGLAEFIARLRLLRRHCRVRWPPYLCACGPLASRCTSRLGGDGVGHGTRVRAFYVPTFGSPCHSAGFPKAISYAPSDMLPLLACRSLVWAARHGSPFSPLRCSSTKLAKLCGKRRTYVAPGQTPGDMLMLRRTMCHTAPHIPTHAIPHHTYQTIPYPICYAGRTVRIGLVSSSLI